MIHYMKQKTESLIKNTGDLTLNQVVFVQAQHKKNTTFYYIFCFFSCVFSLHIFIFSKFLNVPLQNCIYLDKINTNYIFMFICLCLQKHFLF